MLEAPRSVRSLRDPAAFDSWVHKITVRHTMRALRTGRASRVEVPLALMTEIDEPWGVGSDRDLVLAARGALGQALTALPPRQRIALALRYVHDLTDREIAEALQCRRGTVNALLSRARAALREAPALKDLAATMAGDTP
jgi:RNA polymerase sigma-70 factor (ECF subfamily)